MPRPPANGSARLAIVSAPLAKSQCSRYQRWVSSSAVDVDACPASAFGLADEIEAGATSAWHAHARHQVLYASSGTLVLEVASAQWYLPPQRAAFIPAETRHQVHCRGGARLCTVYLSSTLCPALPCGVFSVPPIAREMLRYAQRWGPDRAAEDELAESYFQTLALLAAQWLQRDSGLCLPVPKSSELKRAFDYLLTHLEAASLAGAAAAARVSERTLSRRFQAETGTTLRQFLRTARVLRAMDALGIPGNSVTQVAMSVGFDDVTALSRAFRSLLGETPSEYQNRVTIGPG